MALPLWVMAKISLKVGCTYAGKFASKSLLGPLGKAFLASPYVFPPPPMLSLLFHSFILYSGPPSFLFILLNAPPFTRWGRR